MALNKKQKSYLLVATLVAGITIGGISLNKVHTKITDLNNQINTLNEQKTDLENNIKSMKKQIQEKNNTIDTITEERDNVKESNEKLQNEKKVLQQKLEVKKKEEVSAKLASADYPTQSVSRGVNSRKGTPITMTLTFYGDFPSENGRYTVDAQGNKLIAGTVASNAYSFGTKFELNGQIFTVRDRGGSGLNSSNRLDIFVPRKSGESDSAYAKRIRNYGRKTVTMYKLN